MLLVALVSLTMLLFCIAMLIKPRRVSSAVLQFSHWRYFHRFEIMSRAMLGILFWFNAEHTAAPWFFYAVAVLLCAVAVGLALLGPTKHITVAAQTVNLLATIPRRLAIIGIVLAWLLWYLGSRGVTFSLMQGGIFT